MKNLSCYKHHDNKVEIWEYEALLTLKCFVKNKCEKSLRLHESSKTIILRIISSFGNLIHITKLIVVYCFNKNNAYSNWNNFH